MQWPECAEGFKNHQVERIGQDFGLILFHRAPVDNQHKLKSFPVDNQHIQGKNGY